MFNEGRILLVRAAFVLCVLLPTCVVAAWAVHRSQPAYRNAQQEDWQRFLTQRFGLKVNLGRVSYPSYWVARLDGVELREPESDALLISCRTFEAARTKQAWLIEASQPEVHIDQLATLAEMFESRVLKHTQEETLPCEIEVGELTLRAGEAAQTITNVRVAWTSSPQTSEMTISFHVAGINSPAPCHLILKRDRSTSPAITRWEFSSSDVEVQCSLLATWLPGLKPLGPAAKFVGRASGETSPTGVTAEIEGRFSQVDLNSLVTDHSAHRLTGEANVLVSPLKLEAGRITEIRGTIESLGGYLSDSLYVAAREHLRLGSERPLPPVAQDGLIPYRRLACGFRLDGQGLVIQGNADLTHRGVVLAAAAGPLLLDPTEQPLPASAVLRTLVPATGVHVPATKETLPLLDVLPAPSVHPHSNAPPRVKVRLRP